MDCLFTESSKYLLITSDRERFCLFAKSLKVFRVTSFTLIPINSFAIVCLLISLHKYTTIVQHPPNYFATIFYYVK